MDVGFRLCGSRPCPQAQSLRALGSVKATVKEYRYVFCGPNRISTQVRRRDRENGRRITIDKSKRASHHTMVVDKVVVSPGALPQALSTTVVMEHSFTNKTIGARAASCQLSGSILRISEARCRSSASAGFSQGVTEHSTSFVPSRPKVSAKVRVTYFLAASLSAACASS